MQARSSVRRRRSPPSPPAPAAAAKVGGPESAVDLLQRMQQSHGNRAVQQLMQRFVVQRDPPPVLAPADPKQHAPKDPKTDAPTAWTHLQSFGDSELTRQ